MLNKFIQVLLMALLGIVFVAIVLICILTPEKTKYNKYTNVYKYWTNDAYLCENFNTKVCK